MVKVIEVPGKKILEASVRKVIKKNKKTFDELAKL